MMERDSVVIVVTTPEPERAAGEPPAGVETAPENSVVGEKKVECGEEEVKFQCVIDVQCENDEQGKEEEEKICRICHLNSDQADISTALILLGCGCKGELGIAHLRCGQAWFKLKGNRVCEICGEPAANVTGAEGVNFIEEWKGNSVAEIGPQRAGGGGGCGRGQLLCNLLMACLVIAFVLPWSLRINMF
uniref:RING-CH-type domain-containing protein n=1 Tax=Kalanchoe fedtschenkoi TaxID=63787 RepID=A0A7N0U3Q7_KALFE